MSEKSGAGTAETREPEAKRELMRGIFEEEGGVKGV